MDNNSPLFPTQTAERQRAVRQFGLRRLRYLLSSDGEAEAGREQAAHLELEAFVASASVADPTGAAEFSDEALETVVGGCDLVEGPGKLREAAACYLNDAAAEAAPALW